MKKIRFLLAGLIAFSFMASYAFAQDKKEPTKKYPDGLYAEVNTVRGLIVIQLEFEKTPITVANYVGLVEGKIKNAALEQGIPFYDGALWYRVEPGHVIQCGIPKNGKAEDVGYRFPSEIRLPELNHNKAGEVNMANDGPNTNDNHWCIMLGDRSYLNGNYTVFGHVIEGLDVVFKIEKNDEIKSVKIVRVGPKAEAFQVTDESFTKMREEGMAKVKEAAAQKQKDEEALIASKWPKAVAGEKGLKYIVEKAGEGDLPAKGDKITVSYSGMCLDGSKKFISHADGLPYDGEKPETFVFEIGKKRNPPHPTGLTDQVNPGIDLIISQMKKGEKRTVIVPAAAAYGTRVFYTAKQTASGKRFGISPNTSLVYEIEVLDIEK